MKNPLHVFVCLAAQSGGDALQWGADQTAVERTLRTEQYDSKWLNQPDFIHSFSTDKHVNFLFHEIATEYINCGKVWGRLYIDISHYSKEKKEISFILLPSKCVFFLPINI